MSRPRVGITVSDRSPSAESRARLVDALAEAGASPVLLGPGARLDGLDGLVLPGGGDIDPRRYGADAVAAVREPDPARDDAEIDAAGAAARIGLPTLGICRGLQVLAVAFGGRLVQEVRALPGAIDHEGDGCTHPVSLAADGLLGRLLGERVETNSSHHQAPDGAPPGWRVTGASPDGVVEAMEGPGAFLLGVGWHPEGRGPAHGRALLGALVRAAAGR